MSDREPISGYEPHEIEALAERERERTERWTDQRMEIACAPLRILREPPEPVEVPWLIQRIREQEGR